MCSLKCSESTVAFNDPMRRCWSKTGRFSGLFGTCTDVFLDDCWMKQDMRGSEGF